VGIQTQPNSSGEIHSDEIHRRRYRELTGISLLRSKTLKGPRFDRRPRSAPSTVSGIFDSPTAYISEDGKISIRKILGGRHMTPRRSPPCVRGETLGPFNDFRFVKRANPSRPRSGMKNTKIEFIFADSMDDLDLDDIRKSSPLVCPP